MENILIISNYFPPEKGAAANRIEQLALKLQQNGYKVSVLCPLGNYPKGELFPQYKGKFQANEDHNGIAVKRLWIYPSVSKNILVRMLSVLSFSLCLLCYLLFRKTPRKIVVQSPPLLLSFVAVSALWWRRKKIILNVSDLWPLAAIELRLLESNSFSHRFSLLIEKFIYRKSTIILGQSNEIISHVKSIYPDKNCFLYRNFPEHTAAMDLETHENRPVKIFYAGLLGVAQGVAELCKNIDLVGNAELHLFGDGAEKNEIENLIASGKVKNIHFHGMLERGALHEKIRGFDVALVPLKTRIYGSVPSKIFEYGALGFPVLYCGGGEGEGLVTQHHLGWVAPVGNFEALNMSIQTIAATPKTELQQMKTNIRQTAKNAFDLDRQMQQLIAEKVF